MKKNIYAILVLFCLTQQAYANKVMLSVTCELTSDGFECIVSGEDNHGTQYLAAKKNSEGKLQGIKFVGHTSDSQSVLVENLRVASFFNGKNFDSEQETDSKPYYTIFTDPRCTADSQTSRTTHITIRLSEGAEYLKPLQDNYRILRFSHKVPQVADAICQDFLAFARIIDGVRIYRSDLIE